MKHIFLNVMFTVVFPALNIHSVSGLWEATVDREGKLMFRNPEIIMCLWLLMVRGQ